MNQKLLKELLDYNKDTGVFTWKKPTSKKMKAGDVAGSKNSSGYICICINSKLYLAHRLAWLYEYGNMPENCIDHINGITIDNRICNLREATLSQNQHNRKAQKNNKSGFKGVSWHKRIKKWYAVIKHQHKLIYLGYYDTPEKASEAYKSKAIELAGQFAKF